MMQGPGVATDDIVGRSEVCANSSASLIWGKERTLLVTDTPAAAALQPQPPTSRREQLTGT